MNEASIIEELKQIFIKVLLNNSLTISPETSAEDIDEWTSLTHLLLIEEIETHFEITFSLKEVRSFKSIKNFIDSIKEHKLN